MKSLIPYIPLIYHGKSELYYIYYDASMVWSITSTTLLIGTAYTGTVGLLNILVSIY